MIKNRKLSLRSKAIVGVSVIILFFGILATSLIYVYAKKNIVEGLGSQLEINVVDKATDIEIAIGGVKAQAAVIAGHEKIVNLLEVQDYLSFVSAMGVLEVYNVPSLYTAVYVMSSQGVALASTDKSFINKNYAFRDYFKYGMDGKSYVDVALGVTSGELGYYISTPVINKDKVTVGVVVMKLNPDFISLYLEDIVSVGNGLKIMMVDNNGVIFFSQDKKKIFHSLGLIDDEQKEYEKTARFPGVEIEALTYNEIQKSLSDIAVYREFSIFDEHDNANEILGVAKIQGTPFFIVFEQKTADYVSGANQFAYLLIGFILISVLSAGLMISLVLLRLLKPLVILNKKAKEVIGGNYDVNFSLDSGSKEVDVLATTFNSMIKNIKSSRRQIEEKVEAQTKEIVAQNTKKERQRLAILNILEDVGEEKRIAEQEKNRAESLLESIGDGVIGTDQDGRIMLMNKTAEDLLGFASHEIMGTTITEVVKIVDNKGAEVPLYRRPMVLALSSGEKTGVPIGKTYYYLRKDGSKFPAGITVTPYVWENKIIGTIVVFRDITLEKSVDQAKTEFVSLASHQLKTPLTSINWYVEMLLSGDAGKITDEQKEFLKEISQGSERMVDLVNSLLNVSRIELGTFAVDPELVSLAETAESVIKELVPMITEKSLKINTKFAKLKKIKLDPKLIRIVFQNLLSNAVKYTPEKGQVSVEIEADKTNATIKISDTGYGIPKKDQIKIFTKMFRADNVKVKDMTGTGLGLYLVKSIVEQSAGGEIWFESVENKGTTFYVSIPLVGMKKKMGSKTLG